MRSKHGCTKSQTRHASQTRTQLSACNPRGCSNSCMYTLRQQCWLQILQLRLPLLWLQLQLQHRSSSTTTATTATTATASTTTLRSNTSNTIMAYVNSQYAHGTHFIASSSTYINTLIQYVSALISGQALRRDDVQPNG